MVVKEAYAGYRIKGAANNFLRADLAHGWFISRRNSPPHRASASTKWGCSLGADGNLAASDRAPKPRHSAHGFPVSARGRPPRSRKRPAVQFFFYLADSTGYRPEARSARRRWRRRCISGGRATLFPRLSRRAGPLRYSLSAALMTGSSPSDSFYEKNRGVHRVEKYRRSPPTPRVLLPALLLGARQKRRKSPGRDPSGGGGRGRPRSGSPGTYLTKSPTRSKIFNSGWGFASGAPCLSAARGQRRREHEGPPTQTLLFCRELAVLVWARLSQRSAARWASSGSGHSFYCPAEAERG